MNVIQLRQKIDHQLNSLSPQWLILISNLLDSIQTLTAKGELPKLEETTLKRNKCAQDLLKYANTWQGDDLEECLNFVIETRSKSQF
ncbi:hypothetical protein [Roseofilum capinflatum]|uniref:Uncharacterized protein n=1 Tax=Roseofilum capinflatum BLCC-M114 TaxID=3022440 RepID=A0ABT7B573_9CYAN|nr:hypothetical protein [Roseofilum capinflatum]MDJ1174329.1 hypothetical protein [Roseofilum capinflatum BLCC-M114]